jgi:hypothetical protein
VLDEDLPRLDADRAREGVARAVGHLRAGPDLDTAAGLDVDEAVRRLQVALMGALREVGALDDDVCRGEARIEVAAVAGARLVDVGGSGKRVDWLEGAGLRRAADAGVALKSGCRTDASGDIASMGSKTAGSSS